MKRKMIWRKKNIYDELKLWSLIFNLNEFTHENTLAQGVMQPTNAPSIGNLLPLHKRVHFHGYHSWTLGNGGGGATHQKKKKNSAKIQLNNWQILQSFCMTTTWMWVRIVDMMGEQQSWKCKIMKMFHKSHIIQPVEPQETTIINMHNHENIP